MVSSLGFSALAAMAVASYAPPPKADPNNLSKAVHEMIAGQKPFIGKAGAPVTVVGYIDYECPACRKRFEAVVQQAAKDPKVAVYVEQMPLPLHPKFAAVAAMLALEAEQKGEFAQVHNALLSGKELTKETLEDVAKTYGLPLKPTASATQELAREKQNFLKGGLSFVPVFVIADALSAKVYTANEAIARL